ncbi:pilus assembly protein TadE [Arthrobacter sp. NamB2]|nr:pilus assembly protein TadE [Arthrobacter sp. NamB2]
MEPPVEADGRQRGSVTAEVAVVLPALVVLLALLLGTAHVGTVQLRIEEAARAGAREAMRGESDQSVQQTVRRLAGKDATTTVGGGTEWTTVEVRAKVDGPVVDLLGLELSATATGKVEHSG